MVPLAKVQTVAIDVGKDIEASNLRDALPDVNPTLTTGLNPFLVDELSAAADPLFSGEMLFLENISAKKHIPFEKIVSFVLD